MGDYTPAQDLEGAANYGNFLSKQDLEARKTSAYNALAKVYGPTAGDPELAAANANAQTVTLNAPNVQAANAAKAKALTANIDQYGVGAGDPDATKTNMENQTAQAQNLRQAQFRGIKMLQSSIPPGSDAVDPATFDRVVGANAKTLGLTDPDDLAAFKARVTAPGGAAHLDTVGQALLAPQSAVGAPIVASDGKGGSVLLTRDKNGQIIQQNLAPGITPVSQQNADTNKSKVPILQENATTNRMKIPILQQNANTAAHSANTRANNSVFGDPTGQAGYGGAGGAGGRAAAPGGKASAATTHVGNEDGSATTPTFDKLAPVGSKARATAIGTATGIVNQDTQLQNTNSVISQVQQQISPYTAGTGSLLKDLPGSIQGNLRANLQSLKASGQMAWIASLKNQQGQTGIGRVLQSEAKNAETLFGNMEQDQTAPQLALHLRLFQQTVNQLHSTAQAAFKAQWGQDPYALLGQTPGKGGAGGPAAPADPALAAAYKKYGIGAK